MALKQADRVALEGIQDTITTLTEFNISKGDIEAKLADKIKAFELDTNTQFRFNIVDGKATFSVTDLRSDYVRTRQNTEKTMTSLKAKINGLVVDAKIDKDGAVFSNADIADSLRELADVVSSLPVELTSQPWKDWPRRPDEDSSVQTQTATEQQAPVTAPEPMQAPVTQQAPVTAPEPMQAPVTQQAPVTAPETMQAPVTQQAPVTAPETMQAPVTQHAEADMASFPGEPIDNPLV